VALCTPDVVQRPRGRKLWQGTWEFCIKDSLLGEFVFHYCTHFSARFAAHVIALDFYGEHRFTAGECELVWIIIMIQAEI